MHRYKNIHPEYLTCIYYCVAFIAQMCTYNHVFASDNVLVHCMTMYDNVQQCTEVHQPLVGLHTLEYLLLIMQLF